MNTTILEEAQNMKVRFHIGRGGRFNNAGHKTYVGNVAQHVNKRVYTLGMVAVVVRNKY